MSNRPGEPIWYELLTDDIDKARHFYGAVIGWKIAAPMLKVPGAESYEMIGRADGGFAGGAMPLTAEMKAGGARPGWLTYFGVADVDASVAKLRELGGGVFMDPFDIPMVGRVALVSDAQGVPFYLMRGASAGTSDVFAEEPGLGRCGWNELMTPDLDAALAFYDELLDLKVNERMDMGPDYGPYCFLDAGSKRIGAAMKGEPMGWRFYFHVADIDAAKAAVEANGGAVLMGPHEVPGGSRIIVATDPSGAEFGAVGPAA